MQSQREWITMTAREQRRAHVLARVVAGEVNLWEAAVVLESMGVSLGKVRSQVIAAVGASAGSA